MDETGPLNLDRNPIIRLGTAVVLRTLPYEDAIQRATEDPEIHSLPDEQLEAYLDQTDTHWRAGLPNSNLHPTTRYLFTALMVAVTDVRLRAVAALASVRAGSTLETSRHAKWTTRMSR